MRTFPGVRFRRGAVAAVGAMLTAAAVGLAAVVSASAGTATESDRPRCDVVLLADSLVLKASQSYVDVLRDAGWEPRIVAEAGQSTPWGYRALRRLLEDDSAAVPRTVVVALGTNDTRGERFGFGSMRTRVGQYRRLLGPDRRLIWVDVVLWDQARTLPPERFTRIAEVNRALEVIAQRGRIGLVRWSHRALEVPEAVFRPDGVHYLPEGYRQRAREIAAALGPPTCPAAGR